VTQSILSLRPHHFSISVPDREAALAFWSGIFGFSVEKCFEIPPMGAKGAFLVREGFRLELWELEGAEPLPEARKTPNSDLRTHGTKHMAFEVDGLQGALEELHRRGVKIAGIQRDFSEPMRFEADPGLDDTKAPAVAAFICDPWGTLVELIGA